MADSSFMVSPFSVTLETDDEYIGSLLRRESCFLHPKLDSSSMESARPDVVRWIMKMKAFFGLCSRTAYVALSYFDHFTHRTIDLTKGKRWKIQLLSVACLSLAVKMEERRGLSLTEFQTENYWFDGKVVQRMELLVLSTLEWRMSRVTPFSYLNHCSSKAMGWKAIELIFENIEAMNLVAYRASSIAAASILAAQDNERLTQKSLKSKMSSVPWMRSLNSDEVFSCYIMMIQESQEKK
ncbi:cyclin-D5-3-like [Zingiber officinale]|uniref:Cyclin-like domain-containing protein n=1 Tax=Zingiber officinale TaxID=94328 RepID=A0A8J5KP91_ZINOF|nr:cyclin-D5-3-like [Zingiber officinale]KAG6485794.1 hypothetical protein ZIOFF_054359 [Zingiber officinale]